MTVQRIKGVGYCALTTEVGDWALAVALDCARRHVVRLDIFFFPCSPFEPHPSRGRHGETARMGHIEAIELESPVAVHGG
jgi:hypothetical protein